MYTKISQTTARKLYNQGKSIYLLPSKLSPSPNAWGITPMPIKKDIGDDTFDVKINAYYYYNCTKETGLKIFFYTKD